MKRSTTWLAAFALAAIGAGSVSAESPLNAAGTLRGSQVSFSLGGDYKNVTLTVSGPNGFYARSYSETGAPSIDLIRAGATADGTYTYEITAATSETAVNANPMDNGRGGVDPQATTVGASTSGSFVAKGGLIVKQNSNIKEGD